MHLLIMDTDSGLLMLKRGKKMTSRKMLIFFLLTRLGCQVLPWQIAHHLKRFKIFNSMKGTLKMGCSTLWTLRERSLLLETSLSWAVVDLSLLVPSLVLWLWLLRLTVFLQPLPWVPSFPPPFFLFLSPPSPLHLLFLVALGLHCCAPVFCGCGEWRPLFIAVHGLLIAMAALILEHRLQVREFSSCSTRAQRLQHVGVVASRHVRSF